MFFLLSKTLNFILVPLNWIFILLLIALLLPKKRKALIIFSLVFLYIYTTDFLLVFLFRKWEYPMVWYKDLSGRYDAAIVLGGMASAGKKPDDRTHFPGSPDRLLHAMQLYKIGKVKKIILSGGSGELTGKKTPEVEYLKNVLLLCQVKSEDILVENKSRNTHENAVFSRVIISQNLFASNARFLLITSAWHMKRSAGCFLNEGIDVTPFPADSEVPDEFSLLTSFVPNPVNASRWQILIHEYSGFLIYKIAGYL